MSLDERLEAKGFEPQPPTGGVVPQVHLGGFHEEDGGISTTVEKKRAVVDFLDTSQLLVEPCKRGGQPAGDEACEAWGQAHEQLGEGWAKIGGEVVGVAPGSLAERAGRRREPRRIQGAKRGVTIDEKVCQPGGEQQIEVELDGLVARPRLAVAVAGAADQLGERGHREALQAEDPEAASRPRG